MAVFSEFIVAVTVITGVFGQSSIDLNKKGSFVTEGFLCLMQGSSWDCIHQSVGRALNFVDKTLDAERKSFKEIADAEMLKNQKSQVYLEKPSDVARSIEEALGEVTDLVSVTIERMLGRQPSGSVTKKQSVLRGSKINHVRTDYSTYEDADEELHSGRQGKGKKKKKKKALMKLFLLGAVIKSKIGLLLQLLSAHLQIKFFAIAVIGLLINIARFVIDLKKGHQPQKVIYYEHAQHQHHYDDNGDHGEDYGGYWKRSLNKFADDIANSSRWKGD